MWGDNFHKKIQILEKKFSFFFISFNFLCYYCCSINLKRQSEPSGLRPDTSSLVIIYFGLFMSFLDSDWFIQYLSKYWRVWIRGCLFTGCTPTHPHFHPSQQDVLNNHPWSLSCLLIATFYCWRPIRGFPKKTWNRLARPNCFCRNDFFLANPVMLQFLDERRNLLCSLRSWNLHTNESIQNERQLLRKLEGTRRLVSRRSTECSDWLSGFMEHSNNIKKLIQIKLKFFFF